MKNYTSLIILMSLLIIAAVTNPSVEDHERAVKEKTESDYNVYLEKGTLKDLYSEMGIDIVSETVQKNHVSRTNLVLFSLTNVNSKNVGFGAFGTVIVNADMASTK